MHPLLEAKCVVLPSLSVKDGQDSEVLSRPNDQEAKKGSSFMEMKYTTLMNV